MFKEYEYCDFDTINEDWNVYKVEDDTILRIKFVMVKIVRTKIPGSEGYNYGFNSLNVVGVHSPKMAEPEKRKYSPDELKNSVVKTDMESTIIKEVWNKYRIKKDGTNILVKIVITDIQKTDKYDEYGDPHYFVYSQPVFKVKPPQK